MFKDERLESAVQASDLYAVRRAIRGIADGDVKRKDPQALKCADEAAEVLRARGIELYEEDDGRFQMPPQSEWNEELALRLDAGLFLNFSRKRLLHLQEIAMWLHRKRTKNKPSFRDARPEQEKAQPERPSGKKSLWVKYALIGAVAALAIGVVVVRLMARK